VRETYEKSEKGKSGDLGTKTEKGKGQGRRGGTGGLYDDSPLPVGRANLFLQKRRNDSANEKNMVAERGRWSPSPSMIHTPDLEG